jgi:hypothetical protein
MKEARLLTPSKSRRLRPDLRSSPREKRVTISTSLLVELLSPLNPIVPAPHLKR